MGEESVMEGGRLGGSCGVAVGVSLGSQDWW